MSCDQSKELLVGLLYEELNPEDRHRISEHVASCRECRNAIERFPADLSR